LAASVFESPAFSATTEINSFLFTLQSPFWRVEMRKIGGPGVPV
jgi:hypothetical protein